MLLESMSERLKSMINNYEIIQDTNGMSPAKVFKLVKNERILYLKISHKKFKGTTYDVEREKNVLIWLEGKIQVPKVIHFEKYNDLMFLLMSEAKGLCLDYENVNSEMIVQMYADSIKRMQSIDISECTFDSSISYRLKELDYLYKNKLAAEEDFHHGETSFSKPNELINYLNENVTDEDLVFSHGDISGGNIFIRPDNSISSYIDWGRGGLADKWYDIALCVRNIKEDMEDDKYVDLFFNLLNITPDWNKIKYYSWLDELF